MAESIIFPKPSGATYEVPDVGDFGWGQAVTNFLVAIPNGVVPTAGTFTLTGDLSWGTSFGLLSKYFTSLTANPATAGVVRLAKTDTIDFRNNANSGNNVLAVDGSDHLTYNGTILATGSNVSAINGTANQIVSTNPGGPTVILSLPSTVIFPAVISTTDIIVRESSGSPGILAFQDGGGSNNINIQAPNTIVSPYTLVLPVSTGAADTCLQTNGSGFLQWSQALGTGSSPSFSGLTLSTLNGASGFLVSTQSLRPQATLTFGLGDSSHAWNFMATGAVQFLNSNAVIVEISPDPAGMSSYGLVLPAVQGAAGSFLENDGSGNLSFSTAVSQGSSGSNGIVQGTNTNDDAASGKVGEIIQSQVSSGTPVSLTSGSPANVTSISVPAGDWDIFGLVGYIPSSTLNYVFQSSGTTSATHDNDQTITITSFAAGTVLSLASERAAIGTTRYSFATMTTVYLIAQSVFAGTCGAFGTITARRAR